MSTVNSFLDGKYNFMAECVAQLMEGTWESAVYEEEKILPAWLRWGGAVYAERFFIDQDAAADRSRTWPREYAYRVSTWRSPKGPQAEIVRAGGFDRCPL